jgi:alpha-1,6-mannosyltransferase
MMVPRTDSVRFSGSGSRLGFVLLGSIGIFLVSISAIAPAHFKSAGWSAMVAIMLFSGVLAIAATAVAIRLSERAALLIIIGVALALRIIGLMHEPLLSSDIYRYVWDGKVQAAGINPYRYIPADPALAALRDAVIYPNINRADYAHTAYPPVAQFFFLAATRIGETVLAMRLALVGCEIIIVALLISILRTLKRPLTWIVSYLWHPLAVWEVSNSGHVDVLLATLVVTAIWLLLRGRNILGAGIVALAVLVKPTAAVALPAFWRPWDWRAPTVVIAIIALCYLPYLSASSSVLGFIPGYLKEEGLQAGSSFWLVRMVRFVIDNPAALRTAYIALALATLTGLALRIAFRSSGSAPQQQVRDVALLLMAGLFFLSPNYPWYYLVLVPLIPLGAGAPAWVLTISGMTLHLFWPENYDVRINIWKSIISVGFLVALFVDYTAIGRRLVRTHNEMNSLGKGS